MVFKDYEKVQHFLNNLKNLIINWETSYQELYDKVEMVKGTKEFKDFCIRKHDEGYVGSVVLYLFFKK